MNVATYLDNICFYEERAVALVEKDREVTFGQLLERVQLLAGLLVRLGVQPGERVVIMLPNSVDFVALYMAVLRVGALAVTANYMYRRYELQHILENATPKLFFSQQTVFEGCGEAFSCPEFEHIPVILTDLPEEEGERSLDFRLRGMSPYTPVVPRGLSDPAVMIYTSAHDGGKARGAVLSHGNLDFTARVARYECGLNRRTTHLGALPFFHSYGQTNTMLVSILTGSKVVILTRFLPGEIADLVIRYGITHFTAVPTMLAMLIPSGDIEDNTFAKVVQCVSGGAPLPRVVLDGFQDRFSQKIQEGYGLTEASPTVTYMRLDFKVLHGSVGHPVPGTQVVALDDSGNILPPGEVGEIALRGVQVFQGYWADPDYTKRTLRGGWLHTGDLGFIDADGFITLTGFKKNMFLTGGFNVYPEEVQLLSRHIPEIERLDLFPVEDFIQGWTGRAEVKLHAGVDLNPRQVRRKLADVMALYKVPKTVDLV